jgi:hypothetical protein
MKSRRTAACHGFGVLGEALASASMMISMGTAVSRAVNPGNTENFSKIHPFVVRRYVRTVVERCCDRRFHG